ncbi:hypothetical protein IWX63_000815 [Arthrobacter sp. CAN_A2]|uniref:hypothetical protein n=1 Tax=Arthrobacter sp. CAN_A2 TaxID=2787718 RepID=UPI0018EF50BB
MTGNHPQPNDDPRYEGIYQRGGANDAAARTGSPAPGAPALPPVAEQYAAAFSAVQTGPYSAPWFTHAGMAAPVLLLLGVATAVVQLFVLSIRHTLTAR